MNKVVCIIPMFLCLFVSAFAQWPETIVSDPGKNERRELLLSHGINPEPSALIDFLRNGFNPANTPGGLPQTPQMKSEVANAAIVELGLTAAETAVPVLMEIAEQRPPQGVARIIRRDFESSPLEIVDQEVNTMTRLLSLNAVTALGLIGDEQAAPLITHLMRTEPGTAFVTAGAEALALMGRNEGLASLVLLAERIETQESAAAFRSIFVITGRNYGLTEYTPIAKRREMVAQLRNWFQERGREEPVFRTEVLRRQELPTPVVPVDPSSIRGLLRESSSVTDLSAAANDRRYQARQELFRLAPQSFGDFERIAIDQLEDLDIRRAAMRWMAVSDPRETRSVIKKLRKDENTAIREMAEVLEEDIPKYIEEQKAERKKR